MVEKWQARGGLPLMMQDGGTPFGPFLVVAFDHLLENRVDFLWDGQRTMEYR
jgi:hypothetical protein